MHSSQARIQLHVILIAGQPFRMARLLKTSTQNHGFADADRNEHLRLSPELSD